MRFIIYKVLSLFYLSDILTTFHSLLITTIMRLLRMLLHTINNRCVNYFLPNVKLCALRGSIAGLSLINSHDARTARMLHDFEYVPKRTQLRLEGINDR